MKVEHLSILGTSSIRDTKEILPKTIAHFAHLEAHPKLAKIDQTPFEVQITIEKDIAMFNILKNGNLLFFNICCFDKHDSEAAQLYVRDAIRGLDFYKNTIIRKPIEDKWIFTIPIDIFSMLPSDAQLAGEIEFYIWYAIYRGLKNNT